MIVIVIVARVVVDRLVIDRVPRWKNTQKEEEHEKYKGHQATRWNVLEHK